MNKPNIQTTKQVVPMLYGYSTPEVVRHNGWTKIGYTEQDVETRINQQTHTADIRWQLEWKLDKYQKDIFAKCKLIRPAYMPIIGVETYQNKNFIVIWCPGGETRPYSSPKTMEKNNKERIHYIRKSSNSVEPTDDEEKDLFNLANRVPFDDRVNHKAEISDLNITLKSSPNLCVHSSSSYVSPSMLPLSSGDLIEWSLVCHSTLSYQKFCDRHSNHYDHPEELHQSVE